MIDPRLSLFFTALSLSCNIRVSELEWRLTLPHTVQYDITQVTVEINGSNNLFCADTEALFHPSAPHAVSLTLSADSF